MSEGLVLFDKDALSQNTQQLEKIAQILESRLPNAIEETNKEGEKAEGWAKKWSDSLKDTADTFNEVTEAASKTLEAAEKFGELAVENERNAEAARAFGNELQAVRDAVRGAVSDADLLAARNELLRSGLNFTTKEFETLEGAARRQAKALGTDTKQELDKLVGALKSGSADALGEFNVKLKEGESRAKAFEQSLKTFKDEAKKTGKDTDTVKEQIAAFKVSFNQAATAVAGLVFQLGAAIGKIPILGEAISKFIPSLRALPREIEQLMGTDAANQAAIAAGRRDTSGIAGGAVNEAANAADASIRAMARQRIADLQTRIRESGADFSGVSETERLSTAQLVGLSQRLTGIVGAGGLAGLMDSSRSNVAAIKAAAEAQRESILKDFAADAAATANLAAEQNKTLTAALTAAGLPTTTKAAAAQSAATIAPGTQRDTHRVRADSAAAAAAQAAQERVELRRTLVDIARASVTGEAGRALGAAGAGRDALPSDVELVGQIDTIRAKLTALVQQDRDEVSKINEKLAQRNITLKMRADLEQRKQTVLGQELSVQQQINAIDIRERNLKEAQLTAQQSVLGTEQQLYAQAIASREQGLRLTKAEEEALGNKVDILARMREVEGGLEDARLAASLESVTASTQEAKNAALQRELQIRVQLAQLQTQMRTEEIRQNQEAVKNDVGAQLSKRLIGQTKETTTAAQKFAGVANDVFSSVGEGLASNIVAIVQGQKSAGEAFKSILTDFLAMMTKRSVIEVLSNLAMGTAAAFTPGRQAEAAGYFTAAGIWAAVGVAAGAGLAGVAAASAAPSAPSAGAVSAQSATPGGNANASGGGGGNFSLVVNVSGAAISDAGVREQVSRAVEDAAQRGNIPRYRIGNAVGARG